MRRPYYLKTYVNTPNSLFFVQIEFVNFRGKIYYQAIKKSTRRGNKIKTIVTIGDGIAAWCLHHALKDNLDVQIINISANKFFSPCSNNTTSINCLRGTRDGVSKLGDTVRRAMFFFEEFNQKENPDGVVEGLEYQILEKETLEKWVRRYPEFFEINSNKFLSNLIKDKTLYYPCPAYFINPSKLKLWLHKDINNITYKNAMVKSVSKAKNGYEISLIGEVINADKVVLCTNHLTPLLSKDVNEEFAHYLRHCKPVSGSYLELNSASLFGFKFDKTFNLAIEKYHLIYRHDIDQIQIGATSNNRDSSELPKTSELQEIYAFVNKHTKIELPNYCEFTEKSGIRFKGYYRLPFWGKIDDENLYAVCGLYKNAFTYGFRAAEDLKFDLSL